MNIADVTTEASQAMHSDGIWKHIVPYDVTDNQLKLIKEWVNNTKPTDTYGRTFRNVRTINKALSPLLGGVSAAVQANSALANLQNTFPSTQTQRQWITGTAAVGSSILSYLAYKHLLDPLLEKAMLSNKIETEGDSKVIDKELNKKASQNMDFTKIAADLTRALKALPSVAKNVGTKAAPIQTGKALSSQPTSISTRGSLSGIDLPSTKIKSGPGQSLPGATTTTGNAKTAGLAQVASKFAPHAIGSYVGYKAGDALTDDFDPNKGMYQVGGAILGGIAGHNLRHSFANNVTKPIVNAVNSAKSELSNVASNETRAMGIPDNMAHLRPSFGKEHAEEIAKHVHMHGAYDAQKLHSMTPEGYTPLGLLRKHKMTDKISPEALSHMSAHEKHLYTPGKARDTGYLKGIFEPNAHNGIKLQGVGKAIVDGKPGKLWEESMGKIKDYDSNPMKYLSNTGMKDYIGNKMIELSHSTRFG